MALRLKESLLQATKLKRHSLDVLSVQKVIGEGRPFLPKIFGQTDRVGAKSPIFYLFSLVEPQP